MEAMRQEEVESEGHGRKIKVEQAGEVPLFPPYLISYLHPPCLSGITAHLPVCRASFHIHHHI